MCSWIWAIVLIAAVWAAHWGAEHLAVANSIVFLIILLGVIGLFILVGG